MDNPNHTNLFQINTNKLFVNPHYLNNTYLLIFIFISLFLIAKEQLEISLIIQESFGHYFLSNGFNSAPSKVLVNGTEKSSCNNNKYCDELDSGFNNITIQFNNKLTSCLDMFLELINIIEIDLSNLDFSEVTDMSSMFNGCTNLEKITFGTINTANVNNMYRLFYNCTKLLSIDLSNFDTSSVTNMKETFTLCESITSLDVSTFNTSKTEDMYDMFAYLKNLNYLNLSNFDTSHVKNMQGMFYSSYSLKYLDLSNFDFSSTTIIESMFAETHSLEYIYMPYSKFKSDIVFEWAFGNTSPNLKICVQEIETQQLFITQIQNFDCSDKCYHKIFKYDLKDNICIEYCNQSEYKYEYNNFCYQRCPNETFVDDDNDFICLDKNEEDGYYFDKSNDVFKKCYKTCQSCNEKGDEVNNNCKICKSGFIFLNDSINCFEKCTYHYYFNELNNYTCTKDETCPSYYNKLIIEKNQCIEECNLDNTYKYEYNNICYQKCPNGTNTE